MPFTNTGATETLVPEVSAPKTPSLLPGVLPDGQSGFDIDWWWCGNIVGKHVDPHVQGALMRDDSREVSED